MGPFCHQKRLQNDIHFKASSFPNSNILPSVEHLSSGRRGPIATRQRGSGMYTTRNTGVLLSDFSCPKEKREIKTRNRFVQTEHLCGCSGVQNGNSGKSQTGDSNQRLVFFPRSDRCLSSCAHAQSILEIPQILHLGSSIPIQTLPFGLTTSPYVFTQLITVIAIHLRKRAITLFPYLDDWLVGSRLTLLRDRQFTLPLIMSLGPIISREKSDLIPAQTFVFIGMEILTVENIVRIPLDKV